MKCGVNTIELLRLVKENRITSEKIIVSWHRTSCCRVCFRKCFIVDSFMLHYINVFRACSYFSLFEKEHIQRRSVSNNFTILTGHWCGRKFWIRRSWNWDFDPQVFSSTLLRHRCRQISVCIARDERRENCVLCKTSQRYLFGWLW